MTDQLLQIRLDWLLIARSLVVVLWGVGWALTLQHTHLGRFWARERTWLTVVIGVGVDLAIAFGGDWWTVVVVIAASSLGVISRSLLNESSESPPSGYKTLWGIEDVTALTDEIVTILEEVVTGENGERVLKVSRALSKAHRANAIIRAARRGEYIGQRK